jgi:hypothetical protein
MSDLYYGTLAVATKNGEKEIHILKHNQLLGIFEDDNKKYKLDGNSDLKENFNVLESKSELFMAA